MLGRLALKKVPLEAVSVAPKNNDHLKEVEKDEYPTHLSVRITAVLFCFVEPLPHPLLVVTTTFLLNLNCLFVHDSYSARAKSLPLSYFSNHFFSFSHVAYHAHPTDETHLHRQRIRWTESLCSGQGARCHAHSQTGPHAAAS